MSETPHFTEVTRQIDGQEHNLYLPTQVAEEMGLQPQLGGEPLMTPDEMLAQRAVMGVDGHGSIRNEETTYQSETDKQMEDMLNPANILELKAHSDRNIRRKLDEIDESRLDSDKRLDKSGERYDEKQRLRDQLKAEAVDYYVQTPARVRANETGDKMVPVEVPESAKAAVSQLMDLPYKTLEKMAGIPQEVPTPRNIEQDPDEEIIMAETLDLADLKRSVWRDQDGNPISLRRTLGKDANGVEHVVVRDLNGHESLVPGSSIVFGGPPQEYIDYVRATEPELAETMGGSILEGYNYEDLEYLRTFDTQFENLETEAVRAKQNGNRNEYNKALNEMAALADRHETITGQPMSAEFIERVDARLGNNGEPEQAPDPSRLTSLLDKLEAYHEANEERKGARVDKIFAAKTPAQLKAARKTRAHERYHPGARVARRAAHAVTGVRRTVRGAKDPQKWDDWHKEYGRMHETGRAIPRLVNKTVRFARRNRQNTNAN